MLWVLIAMVLPKSLFFENVAYIELIDSPIVLEDTFVSEGGKLKWYVMLRIFRYHVLLLQHYHSLEHNCNGLSAGVVCRNTYIAVHPTYLGSGAQSDNSDRMHLDARQAIIEEEKKKSKTTTTTRECSVSQLPVPMYSTVHCFLRSFFANLLPHPPPPTSRYLSRPDLRKCHVTSD